MVLKLNPFIVDRSSIKGVKWASENGLSMIDVSLDPSPTASGHPPNVPHVPATAAATVSALPLSDAIPAMLAAALASTVDHNAAAPRRGTAGYFPPLAVSVLSGLPTAGKAELLRYVRASVRPGLPGCAFVVGPASGAEGPHGDQVGMRVGRFTVAVG